MPSYCRFKPIECSYSESVSVSVPPGQNSGISNSLLRRFGHPKVARGNRSLRCSRPRFRKSRQRWTLFTLAITLRPSVFRTRDEARSKALVEMSRLVGLSQNVSCHKKWGFNRHPPQVVTRCVTAFVLDRAPARSRLGHAIGCIVWFFCLHEADGVSDCEQWGSHMMRYDHFRWDAETREMNIRYEEEYMWHVKQTSIIRWKVLTTVFVANRWAGILTTGSDPSYCSLPNFGRCHRCQEGWSTVRNRFSANHSAG